jgi:D-glycero-alpha-D-manno-heptose-7-phosphate kinase
VDLAGGTLDIWPLGLLHSGARTINVAVDLEARVRLIPATRCSVGQGGRTLEAEDWHGIAGLEGGELVALLALELGLPAVAVELESDSPRGGGLGASSALGVAFVAAAEAWLGCEPSGPGRRADLVRDVEARLMGLPTGRQDQLAALLGGALEICYRPGGEVVSHLPVDLEGLGAALVVAYTGQSHFSAGSNWQVVRRRLDGEAESIELFEGITAAAIDVAAALAKDDLGAAGAAVAREWSFRRRLAPEVTTPQIEALLEAARRAGAWGGKATGAGGGGSVALLCPPERRPAVCGALGELGASLLACRPSSRAVSVVDGP